MLDICCAGVPDLESAQDAVSFALQFELLKKEENTRLQLLEVDYDDDEDILASIPTCAVIIDFPSVLPPFLVLPLFFPFLSLPFRPSLSSNYFFLRIGVSSQRA